MTKLNQIAVKERDDMCSRLRDAYEGLEKAVDNFNDVLAQAWESVDTAISNYNEVLSQANSWREDLANQMQEYIDNRSEKWQEGDKGQEYEAWKQQFEEELADVELEKPDPVELDIADAAEMLEQLPETP